MYNSIPPWYMLLIKYMHLRDCTHDILIKIEQGRYRGIPREQRLCQFCSSNLVEDKYHFLLTCPMYRQLRLKYEILLELCKHIKILIFDDKYGVTPKKSY